MTDSAGRPTIDHIDDGDAEIWQFCLGDEEEVAALDTGGSKGICVVEGVLLPRLAGEMWGRAEGVWECSFAYLGSPTSTPLSPFPAV